MEEKIGEWIYQEASLLFFLSQYNVIILAASFRR